MAMDRIMCRQCGNTDADKLDFTPDKRHVYCHICGAATPLYNDFRVVEIEGLQSLEQRLENADQLIALGRFSTAEEKYRELVADYSGDYRTWLGLARAKSKNFEGGTFDWEALNNARRVSDDPEAAGKLEMLIQHCRGIEALDRDIQEKTNGNLERGRIRNAAQVSAEAGAPRLTTGTRFDAEITAVKDSISKQKEAIQNLKKKAPKLSNVLLCGILGAGSVWLYKYNVFQYEVLDAPGSSEWWCLLSFLLMIALCGLFLIKLFMWLHSGVAASVKAEGRIREEQQKLDKLQQEADKVHRQLEQDYEKKMAAYREHQARKMAEAQAIQRDMDAVQDSISSLTGSRKARVDTVRTLALTLSKGL